MEASNDSIIKLSSSIREYLAIQREEMKSEFAEHEVTILAYIERMIDRIEKLELRVNIIEDDIVSKTLKQYSTLLGLTEGELLLKVLEHIKIEMVKTGGGS